MGRICKNKITDEIRDKFGGNPLKVPEARIQPMCVLEIEKNRKNYLGEFKFLTVNGFDFGLPMQEKPASNVLHEQSKSVDVKIGFDILGGFLKALGADPAGVGGAFSKAKKMAFSFTNVRRRFVDVLQLGQILSQKSVMGDINNFMLHNAINNKSVKLGLITDVIVSNNFSISTFTESEAGVDIDVPAVANAMANFNAKVKIEKTSNNQIKFEGPDDLTFAFSALEIKIDGSTGKFSRGDWMRNIKSVNEAMPDLSNIKEEQLIMLDRIKIDENDDSPLLIEF